MPRFSVIATDFEFHVNREGMRAGIQSLADQTFKDFELIIVHDGPKGVPYSEEIDFAALGLNPTIICTPEHNGLWGHPSRSVGMKAATGDYFINFNIDNKFYPHAFERISQALDENQTQVLIYSIIHHKWNAVAHVAPDHVFNGLPPVHCSIDAMQMTAHRDIWEGIGWWYRLEDTSDGLIYERICQENRWAAIPDCLGENY